MVNNDIIFSDLRTVKGKKRGFYTSYFNIILQPKIILASLTRIDIDNFNKSTITF